jgi:hypothetical protein
MAMATIATTKQRPTSRQRKHARELARLERAAALYQRHSGMAVNDTAEAYVWYRTYLADNYPAPGWGC